MTTAGNALLGACLALPLAGFVTHAQAQPRDGRVIYVPPGTTVLILPAGAMPTAAQADAMSTTAPAPIAAVPADAAPMLRLIAEQQAMMQRLFANMDTMLPPFGAPLTVAMRSMPAGAHGVCSQSISIVDRGDGSAPIVKTARTGDACGAIGIGAPHEVNQPAQIAPMAPAHGPRLWEASDPPHPLSGTPPRT